MAEIAEDVATKEENMRQAVKRIQLRNIKSHMQLTTLPQIVQAPTQQQTSRRIPLQTGLMKGRKLI